MFRFANPEYFWLLAAVPLVAAAAWAAARRDRKRRRRLADAGLYGRMVPGYAPKRRLVRLVLLELAVAGLALMLARPQYGLSSVKTDSRGIEVAFAVDVSNSMLAQDVQPSRLERSKLLISSLVDKMSSDRVGLCVFAGEAYPQLPITNDYASAKLFLDNLSPGMVTLQGTNIAAAVNLARISFSEKKEVGKALVIITDGENHEEGAIEAVQEAVKEGLNVYVLGVGSTGGAKIPQGGGAYLRDQSGQEVVTALNEKMCRELAEAGKGVYLHVDNTNKALQVLQEEFSKLKQADNSAEFLEADEQFRAFALIVLLLLAAELLMFEVKNPLFGRFKRQLYKSTAK